MDSILMINSFARAAKNGQVQFCKDIVYGYAHVHRKPVKDVLALISVILMDSTGFEYKEYHDIKDVIRELMHDCQASPTAMEAAGVQK